MDSANRLYDREQDGFTMLELLVSMSMVLVLSAMAVSVSSDIRARAADAQSASAQHNMTLAFLDSFSKLTEGMASSACNGADGVYYKKAGSETLGLSADGAFNSAQTASGAQRPDAFFKPNTDVGYMAIVATGVTNDATLTVATWNCSGSRMYVKRVETTCGTGSSVFTDAEYTLPLPANCPSYPPY